MASRRLAGCVFFATAVLSATHALAIRTRLDLTFDTGSLAWSLDGGLLTNAVAGNGVVSNAAFACGYAATHAGLTNMAWAVDGGLGGALAVGHDARILVTNIASGAVSVRYAYATNSPAVRTAAVFFEGAEALRKTVEWDVTNSRVRSIEYAIGGTGAVARFDYEYADRSDRILPLRAKPALGSGRDVRGQPEWCRALIQRAAQCTASSARDSARLR